LEVKETLKQLLKGEDDEDKKDKDKERSKSKKKKDRKYVYKFVTEVVCCDYCVQLFATFVE